MNRDAEQAPGEPAAAPSTPTTVAHSERGRYDVVERDGTRRIVCHGAPNIQLHIEFGLVVAEPQRADYANQTIFLDGAYEPGPLFDNDKRQYSLDHHQGCIRGFTLATCEQAAVMLCQGLPLGNGEWQLYINDPDLDALLAAWLLLNHTELRRDNAAFLASVMPFVRVEGTIDAHGLDRWLLCGLPEEVYRAYRARIDEVLVWERQLKSTGQWQHLDMLAYGGKMLAALDRLLYPAELLDAISAVETVAQVRLSKNGPSAFLCRGHQGIYAVESQLKREFDKQVGIIVLELGNGRYTLRQVDTFLPKNLSDIYPALNARDERAHTSAEGGDAASNNHWGGSSDIGGSPRKTGSALSGEEVLRVVQEVFGVGGGWFKRLVSKITT